DRGERSYPNYSGETLLGDACWFAPHIVGRRVPVISNETVAPLDLETLLKALQGHEVTPVVLPDGEAYKQCETLQLSFDALLK
ncbi:3-dehydroquinate synthase, partial [Pseudomonas aeruginosa]